MLAAKLRLCSYEASKEEWEAVAVDLEAKGETRLAKAIRDGVKARTSGWYRDMEYVSLRFRGGSIAKLDRYTNGN